MAQNTNVILRSKSIYSIFVRNYSEDGNFNAVTKDLDRIHALGIDIIWLLPIYPIGEPKRKGSLGSPYSIQDYRKINPEYGTFDDFKTLLSEAHSREMKVIIDIVYNHTSHGSMLQKDHPEWFYKDEEGSFGNKVGGWTDVIDLDYSNRELWDYQIETLKYWSNLGVDGFRCDVAPLVPIDFWLKARSEISKLNKDTIWISESLDPSFIKELRDRKIPALSDSEIFQAFDIAYDYDCYEFFMKYLEGQIDLESFLEKKRAQEYIYPANYVKLRFLENHDQKRAAELFSSDNSLTNWTAFMFFEKGTSLLFAGQEFRVSNSSSLFDQDLVKWKKDRGFSSLIKKLIKLKGKDTFVLGNYHIQKSSKIGVIEARYIAKDKTLIGLFNVEGKLGEYNIALQDGKYQNLINDEYVSVENRQLALGNKPVVIEVTNEK